MDTVNLKSIINEIVNIIDVNKIKGTDIIDEFIYDIKNGNAASIDANNLYDFQDPEGLDLYIKIKKIQDTEAKLYTIDYFNYKTLEVIKTNIDQRMLESFVNQLKQRKEEYIDEKILESHLEWLSNIKDAAEERDITTFSDMIEWYSTTIQS